MIQVIRLVFGQMNISDVKMQTAQGKSEVQFSLLVAT